MTSLPAGVERFGDDRRSAILSTCGTFRYALTNVWDDELPLVVWCLLNPSKADHLKNDPTARKVWGFSTRWGFGAAMIVNLFAFRSTNPRELKKAEDPVGPWNHIALQRAFQYPVIAGWGGSIPKTPWAHDEAFRVKSWARRDRGYQCLGLTKTGQPRHPLMLSYTTEREPWQ